MKKTLSPAFVVVIILALGLLGFGILLTTPSPSQVQSKLTELTATRERDPLNTSILEDEAVKTIESYKVFGAQPVTPQQGNLNRTNPFEGI